MCIVLMLSRPPTTRLSHDPNRTKCPLSSASLVWQQVIFGVHVCSSFNQNAWCVVSINAVATVKKVQWVKLSLPLKFRYFFMVYNFFTIIILRKSDKKKACHNQEPFALYIKSDKIQWIKKMMQWPIHRTLLY
jgi:hypothetical protein